MIFHSWCALNPAANIDGVRCDGLDCETHVLRIQTARKNEESRERQCLSCGRPIARLTGAAVQVGMMCIEKDIAIKKRGDIPRTKLLVSSKRSNHAKFS